MSQRALSPRQFMYHHSAQENRASIRKSGLQPRNPYDPSIHELGPEQAPVGVYLARYRDTTHTLSWGGQPGHDLWRVDVSGLHLRADPDDPNREYDFHYSPEAISPSRIKLAKKGVKPG